MAILSIVEGTNRGAKFRLGQRTLTIGRDPGNLIQLVDEKVSRRHAMVRWDGKAYVLLDLSSHNGVSVNGEKVRRSTLALLDRIQLGATVLEVLPDQAIGRDAVLERKVVAPALVAGKTQTLPNLPTSRALEAAAEALVDVDALKADRESERSAWTERLARAAEHRVPHDVLDRALEGIVKFVDPDRCFFYRVADRGRLRPVRAHLSSRVPRELRREPPVIEALNASVEERRRVIANDVPDDPDHIGSALAVPVLRGEDAVIGVIYMDSYTGSRQAYVLEDAVLLEAIAGAVSGAMVSMSAE